jgi:protein phosphatase 1 regulatory subunit 7
MKPLIRIESPNTVSEQEIQQHIQEGKRVIVQFVSQNYNRQILDRLNNLCAKYDDNFHVRFYGHYGESFDCNVLNNLPNVKALSIDCLIKADNIEAVTKLTNLQRLAIGVFEMKETDILSAENLQHVKELILLDTKTKAFNLEHLVKYQNLSSLVISGHTKNIDAVSTLNRLRTLRLNSILKLPLHFVNALTELKSLSIILGGRDNIHELAENKIEDLELVWIRGLNDLSNIGNFRKLKTLRIEDQIRLSHIDFDRELPELSDLKILNCKTLSLISGLENLPALNQFRVYKTSIDFEQFVQQPLPNSLQVLAFYTTRNKVDAQIKERLKIMGYTDGLQKSAAYKKLDHQ